MVRRTRHLELRNSDNVKKAEAKEFLSHMINTKFCLKLTNKEFDVLFKVAKEQKIPFYYISPWGAVPINGTGDDKYQIVFNYECDDSPIITKKDECWIASPDYVNKSDVFVDFVKEGERKRKLPNFSDVFYEQKSE